jgi:outer membrane usher protein FimD/PapC
MGNGKYSISVNGNEVASGGGESFHKKSISTASHAFCAAADDCVQVSITYDKHPGEISWSLAADGAEVLGKKPSDEFSFSIDFPIGKSTFSRAGVEYMSVSNEDLTGDVAATYSVNEAMCLIKVVYVRF